VDDTDKKLLAALQRDVPVMFRPFEALGKSLGLGEAETLERVRRLKMERVVRQISAIFDTTSLGYESSLVAARCEPSRLDAAAEKINAHPGVSHNYRREHEFNLWYTIAVSPSSRLGLARTVAMLHERSGARSTRLLPTLRLFKIGVELDLEGDGNKSGGLGQPALPTISVGRGVPTAPRVGKTVVTGYSHKNRKAVAPLNELEIRFVREMQQDLPVESEPFVAVAGRLGVTVEELRRISDAMRAEGRLRRFGAVLRHREAGFGANGMGIWIARGGDAEIEAAGETMATFRAVTHCYRRPTYPDWPYNLFTMIHARSRGECESVVAAMARETGIAERAVLYSTHEYKKQRVEYFTEAEARWEAEASSQ